ncbi:phytanoyl-CoA dioxygenase family protein [Rhodobacteraceae bacterium CCMM004]|nr:phytanoyl-CoA dioxygenase family protein [Rhodobacteraceae bacterium CCMM004]
MPPRPDFRARGHAEFPAAVPPGALADLRAACDALLAEPADDGGDGTHRIGLGRARQFLAHRHEEFPAVERFLLGPEMAAVVEACLGTPGYLFNEQFVVKGAGSGASFAWHQDGAYVGFDHTPYLTVWIALDDATEENGCVYLLARDLDRQPGLEPHVWQEASNELNGYDGDAPGTPMTAAAGDVVAFSSLTLHRSGENRTPRPRRAYVCQYSAEPLLDPATGRPKRFAKPVGEAPASA